MEEFKEISVKDKNLIDKYLSKFSLNFDNPIISDWNFTNLVFYKEIPKFKYKIIDNNLCLLGNVFNRKEPHLYPIFGEYDFNSFFSLIKKLFKILKKNVLNFCFVPYNLLGYFLMLKKHYDIKIDCGRDESDYVYSILNFKKCIKKNRMLNFMKKHNPNFEIINEKNKNNCLDIQKKYWCKIKKCKKCTYCSFNFIKNLLNNYKFLDICGFFVKNKYEYLGFVLTLKNTNTLAIYETKYCHLSGLNYYIFDLIVKKLADSNIKWINFAADDGIENLRRYKRHFCKKYELLNKYYIEISKI
ncbi:MAG: DUF2156 domain-containing protein [Candidatus Improbicoccus pseudotrichonymphae]|uniref:DUF2156 domain-containing protein n=1 Tax=Candidatus Improbicoccus pseudotrichonymphae TaxID=3033792 RepID=A0AA48HYA5_9FIRM|nr:MAG: DUF2156 domain-containing protein [Candidatus Improbicoccus pseudotrichonymphae]